MEFYTASFVVIAFLALLTQVWTWLLEPVAKAEKSASFKAFQRNWLLVYMLAMFADWLKGPYVYALYDFYGFSAAEIAWLYIGGFASSLLLGTWAGCLSDKYGRRNSCLVFVVVYILSALTKPINSFWPLMVGRWLSGIATSLLFTAFEAWMTSEHYARGFPAALLPETFALASMSNGFMAVAAGLVSQATANHFGYLGPFLLAIVPLTLVGVLVFCTWSENYGDSTVGPLQVLSAAGRAVKDEYHILYLGCAQSMFEGAMYTWVFLWTPAVVTAETKEHTPYGTIFASFMACLVLGGCAFRHLVGTLGGNVERLPFLVHGMSMVALLIPAFFMDEKRAVFLAFCLYETACGIFFPTYGTIRSIRLPEATRTGIMNLYRVPLNLFVIVFLLLSTKEISVQMVFGVCGAANFLAILSFTQFRQFCLKDSHRRQSLTSVQLHTPESLTQGAGGTDLRSSARPKGSTGDRRSLREDVV